jgi:chromosome segregation ATPase
VFTVQSVMLIALGFLAASLLGLLVASAFWSRAVRLTTTRIKQSMPVSEPEIRADRDRLRAEYAIKVHKLEMQLEQAKLARARQHIEINRREASISTLETDIGRLKVDLEENQNARRVLEQTVTDRLPRVEARLAEAKRLLFNRDREIAELTAGSRRHKQALEEASSITAQQTVQIQRLTSASTAKSAPVEAETSARGELDALRAKAREQAALIDRLQRRLGSGYGLTAPAPEAASPREEGARAAKKATEGARHDEEAREGVGGRLAYEREIRALRARTDDQAGEIARLRSALAAFEDGSGTTGSLRDSKLGLKARLGAVQAQSDQQTATIGKLRAELAAAHERLARQAAHFMDEMRRIGTGGTPNPNHQRQGDDAKRRLAERVAEIRAKPSEKGVGNGSDSVTAEPAAAAEMPQEPQIPGERRRSRLLDRITSLGKS